MSPDQILDIGREAIWVTMLVGAPSMACALVLGLGIAILQALTQVQEATVAFVPKLLGVALALVVAMPWTLEVLRSFTVSLFGRIAAVPSIP
ncbi:MAG: flagellar export apparatus protein FliQ [Geminicoccaceae bacterium]|nr:MAG: flagellar export apparatus protein FliQ [Geminicoccaceae bacterium]